MRDKLRRVLEVVERQRLIEAWVVSNAVQAEEEVRWLTRGPDDEIEIKLMRAILPKNWRNSVEWEIQGIQELKG